MEKTAGGGPEVKQQPKSVKHDTKWPWDRLGVALRPRANNKDVDLLLEVEVTESLLEAMSADTESADSKNSLVEVTIIRPPEVGIIKSAQAEQMERKKMERKRLLEDKLKEIKAKLETLADDSELDDRETEVKPAGREAEVNATNRKIEVKPDLIPRKDNDSRPLHQSEPVTIKQFSPEDITLIKFSPITSCDVERSFSRYRNILFDYRRGFEFDNLKMHMIMQWNFTAGKEYKDQIDPGKRVGKSVVRGDVKNSMPKSASANEPQPAGNGFHRNASAGNSVAESQLREGHSENRSLEMAQHNIASTMPEQYRLLWASMKNLEAQLIHIGQVAGIETRPPDMETHADGSHLLENYGIFKNEIESQRAVPGERGEMVYNLQTDTSKFYFARERAPKEIQSSQNPTNEALQRQSCVEKAMEYHMEQRSTESIGDTLNLTNKRSSSRVSLIEEFIRHTSYEGRPTARPQPSQEEHKQQSCEQTYSKTSPEQHDFCGMMDCIVTDNRTVPNTQTKTVSSRERLMVYCVNEGNRPVSSSRQPEQTSDPDEEEYIDIVQHYNTEHGSMTGHSFTEGNGPIVRGESSAVQVDIVVNDKYLSRLARDMQQTYVSEQAQSPERVQPRKGCGVTVEYSDVPEKQHRIMTSTKAVRDISVNTDTPSVINQLYHDINEQERSQYESIGVQTSVHPGSRSESQNTRSPAAKSWADDRTQKFLLYSYQDVPDSSSDLKEDMKSFDKRTCDPNVKRMKGNSPIQPEKSQRIVMKDSTSKNRDRNSEERNRNHENSRQSLRSHSRESSQKDNRKGNRVLYPYKRADHQRSLTSGLFRSTDRSQKSEKSKRSSDDPNENLHGSTHTYFVPSKSNQDITAMDYIPNSDNCSQIAGRSKAVGQIINNLGSTVICYNCAQRGKVISERVPSMYGCETECQSKDSHLEEQTVRKNKEEKKCDSQIKESHREEYQTLNSDLSRDEEERTEKLTTITNLSQQNVTERQDFTSVAGSNHCLTVTYGSTTDSHTSVLIMPEEPSRATSREVLHDPTGHNRSDGGDVPLPSLPNGWSQLVDTVHGCIWTWDGKTLSPGFDLKAGVEKLLINHLAQKSRKSEEEEEEDVQNNMDNLSRISQEVEQELRSKLYEYNKAFMDNETLTRLIDLKNELKKPTTPVCTQNHIVHTAQIDTPHFPVNHIIDCVENSTVGHYDSSQVEPTNSSFSPEILSTQKLERRSQNQQPSMDEKTSLTTQIRTPSMPLNVEPQLSKQNTHKCQKYSSQDVFKKPQHNPVRDHPSQANESPTRAASETAKERCSTKDMEVKTERKLCHQEYVALTGPASIGRHSPLSDINASGGESSLHVTYLNPWIKDWTTQSENDPPMDFNKSRLRTEKVHTKSLESTISSSIEKKNQFRSDWTMSRCSSAEKKSEHLETINDKSIDRPDTACETTKPSADCGPRPAIKTNPKCSISQRSFTGSKSSLGSLKCSSKLSLSSTKSKSDRPKKCIVGKVKNYHSNGDIEIEIELSYRDLEKLLIQRQKQKRKRLSSLVMENGRSKVQVSGSGRSRTTEEEKQTLNDVEKLSG